MLITSFSIKKLFGLYSYEFKLEEDQNIFLITGPNGYGKTTILTIINNLYLKDILYFHKLNFERINVDFKNNQRLEIKREAKKEKDKSEIIDIQNIPNKKVEFIWYDKKKEIGRFPIKGKKDKIGDNDIIDFIDYPYDSENASRERMINLYFRSEYAKERSSFIEKEFRNSQISMLLESFSSSFIEAQRIFTISEKRRTQDIDDEPKDDFLTIHLIADELKKVMEQSYFDYLKMAQKRDSQFLEVLLSSENKYSEDEYKKKADEMEKILKELVDFGLISKTDIKPYSEEHTSILSSYIDELEYKIKFYNPFLEKLRLFIELIKKKQFANKSIELSVQNGLRIKSPNGEFINVQKLSSGEQNEIIMLYNFIFKVNDDTILLVDEPENSLHIVWQQEFIDDIQKIAELKNLQVIIATHSPQIIGERWSVCYDLYENNLENA